MHGGIILSTAKNKPE